MTTPGERLYLYQYARDHYTGQAAIIELGSWLGSLVAALAEGLQSNSRIDPNSVRIHAFDNFQFYPWMRDEFSRCQLPIPQQEGESFLDLFTKLMKPWQSMVVAHEQDLSRPQWKPEPIELLVVDVMKSWELANAVLRSFFPHLVPGLSIVLHQDFADFSTPWIILTMHRLRDYFEHVGGVAHSGSVVFRLTKQIPPEMLQQEYSLEEFSQEEVRWRL